MKKGHDIRVSLIILFLTAIILIGSHGSAMAHKVMIFAWVEGDTVFTESKFSGGKKAINAPVVIFDKNGKKLLEGKTDNKGKFSFKIPKVTDLRIVLNAAMGHKAEWTVPESEIRESGDIVEKKSADETSGLTTVRLSKEEVRKIVEDSLDKKLRPIVRMITESKNTKPSLTEIIGGIGYIFGLMGVALYFMNRGKKR
ncbi:MAG: nickel transport protein [Desulfobacteraceae bacterium Eth-SRB2]|nr:MAG: nickel transport protein [Desulfobacteraceae bacterium Eth-SRB2]